MCTSSAHARGASCSRWLCLQRDPTVWQRHGDQYVIRRLQSRCADHVAGSNPVPVASFPDVIGAASDGFHAGRVTQRVVDTLIPPKVLEPCRRQFRISDRVADIPMPKVILNGPRIVAIGNQEPHACGVVRNVCCDVPAPRGAAFNPSAAPPPLPNPAFACTS
jgi:hypothetical protein